MFYCNKGNNLSFLFLSSFTCKLANERLDSILYWFPLKYKIEGSSYLCTACGNLFWISAAHAIVCVCRRIHISWDIEIPGICKER
jgi:hypothetical protein